MICRIWKGWTTPENADKYEAVVRGEVIPAIEARRIPGFLEIDLVREVARADADEVCFCTLMWFESLDGVIAFTGEDYAMAHVPSAARAVLKRFEARASHYDVLDRRPQR